MERKKSRMCHWYTLFWGEQKAIWLCSRQLRQVWHRLEFLNMGFAWTYEETHFGFAMDGSLVNVK